MSSYAQRYATIDKTKWAVIEKATLTGSGYNEVRHRTRTRVEAETYAQTLGKRWRRYFAVVRSEEIFSPSEIPGVAKVGDQLTTEEQLSALPYGAVVRGEDKGLYEVDFYAVPTLVGAHVDYTMETAVTGNISDDPIIPVTVLYLPAQETD